MKSKGIGLGKAKVRHGQVTIARLRGIVARRQILSTGCLLAAVILLGAVTSQGQAFVFWSNSVQYDNGFNPKVAYSGTTVVEVHNGTGGAGPLWYRVGQLSSPFTTIVFGNSHEYETSGFNPSVALSGTTVVEVHNRGAKAGPLWYRVGTVNTSKNTIKWGKNYKYDTGFNPSVGISGTGAVEVHNGGSQSGPEWYRVGTVDASTKTIQWSSSNQYDNGFNPSVSVSGSEVVEVHNGGNGAGPLWYRTGEISGSTIQWQNSAEYVTSGNNPSIGFNGYPFVEVHNGDAGGVVGLWDDTGEWFENSLLWQESANYDVGMNPSVSLGADYYAVEVHNGTSGAGPLWYRIGHVEVIQ